MPITQSRVIAIISAALDYQQASTAFTAVIRQQGRHVASGRMTPAEALEAILAYAEQPTGFLQRPIESATTIAVEHRHFTSHARANAYAADRMARSRARQHGITPPTRQASATTAPPAPLRVQTNSTPAPLDPDDTWADIGPLLGSGLNEADRRAIDAEIEPSQTPDTPDTQ